MHRSALLLAGALALVAAFAPFIPVPALAAGPPAGAHGAAPPPVDDDGRTPAERMAARFPQKVRVGDLIGLPVQDYDDRIIGHVAQVARTPTGGIVLVMPQDGCIIGRFSGWLGFGGPPVPIPIETVAILGRHLNLLDIPREEVPRLPAWLPSDGHVLAHDETIRIAISRR